jgi:hypothetical protein
MRALLALGPALLAAAQQHGHGDSATSPPPPTSSSTPSGGALAAPPHCLRLSSDADWPARSVWDAELAGWESLGANTMGAGKGQAHPDVKYEVKRTASVQRALAFAKKHRVRLSIIASGHDFPAR